MSLLGPRLILCGLAHLLKYIRAVPTGVKAHGNIRKLAERFVASSKRDANVSFGNFLQGLGHGDGPQIQGIVVKAMHDGSASIDVRDIWYIESQTHDDSTQTTFFFGKQPGRRGFTRVIPQQQSASAPDVGGSADTSRTPDSAPWVFLSPEEIAEFRGSHCDVEWINGDFSNFCFIRGDDVSMSNQQAGVLAQHFGEILGEMCKGNVRKFDANAELIPILRFLIAIQWHETHHESRRYGMPNIDDKIQMVMLVLGVNVSWDVNHLQYRIHVENHQPKVWLMRSAVPVHGYEPVTGVQSGMYSWTF